MIGSLIRQNDAAFFEDDLPKIFANITKRLNGNSCILNIAAIKTYSRICESIDIASVKEGL